MIIVVSPELPLPSVDMRATRLPVAGETCEPVITTVIVGELGSLAQLRLGVGPWPGGYGAFDEGRTAAGPVIVSRRQVYLQILG